MPFSRRPGPSHAAKHSGGISRHGTGISDLQAGNQLLILAALVTVYIVLGVLIESYIHPITIM